MDRAEIIATALQVCVKEYGPNTRNWSFELAELESFVALVADKAAAREREAASKWRLAIDHEMVVAHLGVAAENADPADLLRKVIQWNVDVALNPDVSEPARALLARERELCAQVAADTYFGNAGEVNHEIAAAIRARGQKGGV